MRSNDKNKIFELGQWVGTEDGYGQILDIRPLYVENYETDRRERKNGEFIRNIFICKILCDFNGKVKTKIRVYTSINNLSKEGAALVKAIKQKQPSDYLNYIIFDDKIDVCRQIFLDYKLPTKSDVIVEELKQKISHIEKGLLPAFTFKEFLEKCRENQFLVDVEKFIPYGYTIKEEEKITIRLDSYRYKVKGKESVFHRVWLFG